MKVEPETMAQLKISRKDLIDQLIRKAREDNKKNLTEASNRLQAAARAFNDELKKIANVQAKPVLDVLKAHCTNIEGAFDVYTQNVPDYRGQPDYFEQPSMVTVTFNYSPNLYRGETRFHIDVPLKGSLRELRKKILDAEKEFRGYQKIENSTHRELQASVTYKIINQAINEMPEGKKLLEMMDNLKAAVEKRTGKPLLLGG